MIDTLDSTYGAAASIIVVLIWVYYSSQIIVMDAEVTHAFSASPAVTMLNQRVQYQRPRPYKPPPPSSTMRTTMIRSVVISICVFLQMLHIAQPR
jgi:hypothetical protein